MPATQSKNYYETIGNSNPRTSKSLTFAHAQALEPTEDWYEECQKFVREALGCPAGAPSAHAAWLAVPDGERHSYYEPPAGVPVYWSGGIHGFGHAALSAGNGKIWSTDIMEKGHVSLVELQLIHNRWDLIYLGWTETCNGVVVYTDPTEVVSVEKEETPTE